MYFCLTAAQRPTTVNGFLALQPPYIVQYRLSQCQACQWVLWGPDSIWLPAHTGPTTTWHTHTHIFTGPWPLTPFPLFQQPLTRSATVTSVSPVGMVTLPSPSQVTLARPNTLLGVFCVGVCSVCVCVWPCLSGTSPNLVALCHCTPTTWQSVCFPSQFLLHYSTHRLLQLSRALFFLFFQTLMWQPKNPTLEKVSIKYYIVQCTHMRVCVHVCPENALYLHVHWFSVRLHNNTKGSHLLHPGPWVSSEA